jgi:hypothetical protein
MPRERPTSVLVMAILNLIFGGLGLVCICCGAAGLLGFSALAGAAPGMPDIIGAIKKEIPSYVAVVSTELVLSFILTCALVASGVGLLSMQSWARWTAVAWAVLVIPLNIAETAYQLVVVQPAMERVNRELLSKTPGARPTNPPASNPVMENATTFCSGGLNIVYAIALLIVMFLPDVSAAFAGRGRRRKRVEDEDDFGEIRYRRREDEH